MGSRRPGVVRSAASRRARVVATKEARGGGGEGREERRVESQDREGWGMEEGVRVARIWAWRSTGAGILEEM